jgi:hypothetical protein
MFRFFVILFLCAIFVACSSDDSATLEWFKDQGIATSYGKKYEEIDIFIKKDSVGFDSSVYMVGSYAALGNANGVEQLLYFGLEVSDTLSHVWKLRTDSIFYKEIYGGEFPTEQKIINAKFCWLEEKTERDSLWLELSEMRCEPKSFNWTGGTSQDTFYVELPDEFLNLRRVASPDTKLLVGIKLHNSMVLRIAPPSTADIPGLLYVAQKTIISDECKKCLHAGVRESLSVVFEIGEDDKKKIAGKTVVFAQLVLPKSSDTTGSELGMAVPVYVYGNGDLEDYRVDTAFVEKNGHPNLVFWEGDSLKLQVTRSLRNYASTTPDTLGFTLRLGVPMLNPKSLRFYNSDYISDNAFSNRPAYSSYNFSSAFENAKLRLWFADFYDKE